MLKLWGRRYENGEPVCLAIDGNQIAAVDPAWPDTDVRNWPWIAPGMLDLQINGHGGTWFSKVDLTADEVLTTLEPHFRFGITRLCPTLITNSREALIAGFSAIREACEREHWADRMVPGCHLEGPYISSEDGPRGAHPLEHVRPADWEEFQELQAASGGRIRLVTLAPEAPGALEFIRHATSAGVVISIGHTAAEPEQVTAAVNAGARLSTHLGNGAHGNLRRHPNYIWEQLGDPRLTASIITDGHHLPASVVRSVLRTKSSLQTIITCDASGLAGCPPGLYHAESGDVEILEDGRLCIAGQRQLLAGSGLETDSCVAKAVQFTGVSLHAALDMAGRIPARLLGFEDIQLRRGSRADVILFHHDLEQHQLRVVATIADGDLRFGEIPEC